MKIFVLLLLGFFLSGWRESHAAQNLAPRIHFLSNRFDLLPSEEATLNKNVEWLQENPSAVVILEGHCDEWGEETYNLQLGDLRAREVKSYLIQKGIDPERIIMVVSFGEQSPLDAGHSSEAWRQNRRVEFVLR